MALSIVPRKEDALDFMQKFAARNPKGKLLYVARDSYLAQRAFRVFRESFPKSWSFSVEGYRQLEIMLPNGAEIHFISAEHPFNAAEAKSLVFENRAAVEVKNLPPGAEVRFVNPANFELEA